MGGVTIHSSGEIPVGGQYANRRLEHLDVDVLFTKNQHLRWILIDEALMIPDELLGQYAANFESAARDTRYRRRADSSPRIFGGYNVLLFGDMNQLPPIPSSTALFIPPISKKSETARQMLNMFWEDGPDSLNFYVELTKQERIQDEWYRKFLHECRQGQLTDEMYYFIIGVPTEHPGSWTPGQKGERPFLACRNDACALLPVANNMERDVSNSCHVGGHAGNGMRFLQERALAPQSPTRAIRRKSEARAILECSIRPSQ